MCIFTIKAALLGWLLNALSATAWWVLILDRPGRDVDPEERAGEALGTLGFALVPWVHVALVTVLTAGVAFAWLTGWRPQSKPPGG